MQLGNAQYLESCVFCVILLCMFTVLSTAEIGEEISVESAQELFGQGEYAKCLGVLSKLLEEDPNNADAHAWMGSALGMLAQNTPDMMMQMQYGMRAIQEFETAVQLDPNNIIARLGRGMSMLMAPPPFGNVDTALSDFQKAVKLDPNSPEGHFYLGLAYQKKGAIEKARAEFEKTLQLDPDHVDAKAELGKLTGEKTEPTPGVDGGMKYRDGWLERQNGFLVLHLKGAPYDTGYQHGMLMKGIMGNLTDQGAQVFGLDEQTHAQLRETAKQSDEFIPEEYREQMRGLADALETPYDEILLWNVCDVTSVQSCTNFLTFGRATVDGKVVHGANSEYGDIVMNRMLTGDGNIALLAVYEPDDGHKFAVVMRSPVMIAGSFGINDAGLTISLTSLPAKDSTHDGIPVFILLRKVIQYADSVPAALKIVQEAPRDSGFSMTFADGKTNQGAVIECSATQYAVRESVDGTLVATNRMADKKLYEAMQKGILSNGYEKRMSLRGERYAQMFKANYGQIDVRKAVGFLRDHLDLSTGKNTISPPVIGSARVISSVVFKPADFDFWVARGAVPMVYGEFVGFNLKSLLAGEKSQVTPARIPRDAYVDSEEFRMELKKLEEEARQR
jgi:tetratricopeptide (TPR) repeat protein